MSLEQLHKAHIIDTTAYAMGRFINQHNNISSDLPGILCALSMQSIKLGHTCLDCTQIAEQFPALINYPDVLNHVDVCIPHINPYIGHCQLQVGTLFTFNQSYLFSNKFLDFELRLLHAIDARINSLLCPSVANPAEQLAHLCMLKPLCFLSGGPGTGKTTCLTQALPLWIELFQKKFNRVPNIILCAPTGKAAARMTAAWYEHKQQVNSQASTSNILDCIPEQAITLHRLLAINPLNRQSKFNQQKPLIIDLLVVDEASMIDLPLFVQLLEAIPLQSHVLLIGDANQLPAIEAGCILDSLLNTSSALPFFNLLHHAHLHLDINYRQKDHPGLSHLAKDCLEAEAAQVADTLLSKGYNDVTWQENSPQELSSAIKTAAQHYASLALHKNADSALQASKNFCLLTAVREGQYGCININLELARKLNPNFQTYYHGQLLLITENAKHLGLANGDVVIIWRQTNQQLMACFESSGGVQTLTLASLPAFESAYALTIHKSQGSEYNQVMVILPELDSPVLSKALLYTAFTRAKCSLQIIASRQILVNSLQKLNRRVNGLDILADQLVEQKVQ